MLANKQEFEPVKVLSEEEFRSGHILGAIDTPLDELQDLAKKHLKKTGTIVVYCASTNATRILLDIGYRKTLDYKGGKKGWPHAGFELEK